MERNSLLDKEVKETVIRMLNKLESRIDEFEEHFNKFLENIITNEGNSCV